MYSHRTKEKRDELAKQLSSWKPEEYTKHLDGPDEIKYRAEGLKVPDAVDQRIAATDPTFRTYLNELKSHTTYPDPSNPYGKTVTGMPMAHMQYLEQARMAWWTAENAKVQVNLTGTALSLSSHCTQ